MGTRSLTVFKDNSNKEIVVLYRQFDGYPESHGKELADFLKGKKIVNGIAGDTKNIFNGMYCLAASVISHFKKVAGAFYIYPAKTRNLGEDYVYYVKGKVGEEATIEVEGFNDFASEYQKWIDN